MTAKRLLAAISGVILAASMVSAVFAYESPSYSSVTVDQEGVTVTVSTVEEEKQEENQVAAEEVIQQIVRKKIDNELDMDYLIENINSSEEAIKDFMDRVPENPSAELMMQMDLKLDGAEFPCDVTMNVSGIKADDAVIVAHILDNGEVEYLVPKDVSNGNITVEITSCSPFLVYTLTGGEDVSTTLPQTGEANYAPLAVVALVAACAAAVVVAKHAIKD